MQPDDRKNSCIVCGEPAQVKNANAIPDEQYWPWCFDHMVEESIKLDKSRRVNENRTCITPTCGWPATLGGICIRCARVEAEHLYRIDRSRRQAEELAAIQEQRRQAEELTAVQESEEK